MKWGLFGGTFDPIHFGHLRAAEELAALVSLSRVIFIPAALPPHKTSRAVTPFDARAHMTRLAIDGNPLFSCSDVEALREGKSYSIDTVRYFLETFPDVELYFITGQDAFDAIATWHDWKTLLTLCHFIVMTRPGYSNEGLEKILPPEMAATYVYNDRQDGYFNLQGMGLFFRKTTFLDISASDIRHRVFTGQSVRYLTPEAVIKYLEERRIYGKAKG